MFLPVGLTNYLGGGRNYSSRKSRRELSLSEVAKNLMLKLIYLGSYLSYTVIISTGKP